MYTIESRGTMTDAEWKLYTDNLAKNVKYEQDKVEAEKAQRQSYKNILIDDIIHFTNGRFTREELAKKSLSTLERIHDYV